MKTGVYGGTFNPPHLGHLKSAQLAAQALGLDRLLFVPAAIPPHKSLPADTPEPEHRAAMLELMADYLSLSAPELAEVSRLELDRTGKSYTAETLTALQEARPETELWLLMGADMLLTLHQWHKPERIMELAGVAAFARGMEESIDQLQAQCNQLERTFGARVRLLDLPEQTDISSTRLRQLLAEGKGQDYLAPPVYGYILRHGLYGTHTDLKQLTDQALRACSYSMMRAKRIPHVRGTETEAVRLADRWGADTRSARRAAILHDCTKYYTREQQLAICTQYGIELDSLEQEAVKLLHSKTGACLARHLYGAGDDIYEAIFWHTTGKADMSVLEKILYLADYMEPTRNFPGVERLRMLAYTDLDAAVLAGCELSIQEMADRSLPVHPNTLMARQWLLSHKTT